MIFKLFTLHGLKILCLYFILFFLVALLKPHMTHASIPNFPPPGNHRRKEGKNLLLPFFLFLSPSTFIFAGLP